MLGRARRLRWNWLAGLVVASVLGVSLAACGGESSPTTAPRSAAPAPTTPPAITPSNAGQASTSMTPTRTVEQPSTTPTAATNQSPRDLAPELAAMAGWYNSEPVTLEALRGQPVLLVFWSTI